MCLVQTVFVWLLNLLFIRHRPSFPRKATLYPRLQYSHVRVSVCPKKGPKITSSSSKPPVSGGHSKYRFLPEKGPRIHLKFIETSGFRRTIKISFFARKRAQKTPQVHQNLRFQADTKNIVFCLKKGPEFTSSSSKPPVSGWHSKYRFSPEKEPRKHLKFLKTSGFRRTLKISFFARKRAQKSVQVHQNHRFSGGHTKYRFQPEKGPRNQVKFIKTTGSDDTFLTLCTRILANSSHSWHDLRVLGQHRRIHNIENSRRWFNFTR